MIGQMDFTLNAEKIEVRSARGDTDHAIGSGFENLSIGGLLIEIVDGVLTVNGFPAQIMTSQYAGYEDVEVEE